MNTRLVKPKTRSKKASLPLDLNEKADPTRNTSGFISPFKMAAEFPVTFAPYRRILE